KAARGGLSCAPQGDAEPGVSTASGGRGGAQHPGGRARGDPRGDPAVRPSPAHLPADPAGSRAAPRPGRRGTQPRRVPLGAARRLRGRFPMSTKVLEFERPIVELEGKIKELKHLSGGSQEMAAEIERLEQKARQLQRERFAKLSPWEQVQLAKHPDRPYTLDYIGEITTEFVEFRG